MRVHRPVGVEIRVPKPRPDSLESLEMVEDQRLAVDSGRVCRQVNVVLHEVPGREVHAEVLDDADPWQAAPAVKVSLVGKLAILHAVEAPLKTLRAPSAEYGAAGRIVAKGHPGHVVRPPYRKLL